MEIVVTVINSKEKTTPNYVIPTSNFTGASILGVPCKVLSDHPYPKSRKTILGNMTVEDVIDVQSCVTGIYYTIPIEWTRGYDSLVEANDNADIIGHHFPDVNELIGKYYWPYDNSYIEDLNKNWFNLYHKQCRIVSAPFKAKPPYSDYEHTFVMVEYNGRTYRTLFGEWALTSPKESKYTLINPKYYK